MKNTPSLSGPQGFLSKALRGDKTHFILPFICFTAVTSHNCINLCILFLQRQDGSAFALLMFAAMCPRWRLVDGHSIVT